MTSFSEQLAMHWAIGGALTTSLWFLAGKKSKTSGETMFWLGVGTFIAVTYTASCIVNRVWLGSAVGIMLSIWGIRSIVRAVVSGHDTNVR